MDAVKTYRERVLNSNLANEGSLEEVPSQRRLEGCKGFKERREEFGIDGWKKQRREQLMHMPWAGEHGTFEKVRRQSVGLK